MKYIIPFILFFAASVASAELVVTSKDVEIRFPDADPAGAGAWVITAPKSVNYWGATETPGTHNPKCKLGDQTWRAWLQDDDHNLGGVEFVITVNSLPKVAGSEEPARRMELQFCVRDVVGDKLRGISPWSPFNFVDIIGKPGLPNMQ